jgi:glycosyltransferase involved in cell wall biosynthesis
MKKLLFISHEASRTGAPMLLLNLIEWLVTHKSNAYNITVLCVKGGDLVEEFEKLVPTIVLDKKQLYKPERLNKYIVRAVNKYTLYKLRKHWDLIFSNTIVNGKTLELLKQAKTPVITYVHELEPSIAIFHNRGQVEGTFKHTNYFLCGSKLVQQNLIENHNRDILKTQVVNSFVKFEANQQSKSVKNTIKKELNIPNDALVVGMMGSFINRKGTDFFIDTARKLNAENIYFIWVGADEKKLSSNIKHDLKQVDDKKKLVLIPPTKEYFTYFNAIDVFYLSSREDPYPMVMVEATSYGIPIVCFENAGGTQEFIDNKVGHVIPFADTGIAATKILEYHVDNTKTIINSDYIKEKSKKVHDVNYNAATIVEVIDALLKKQ